MEIIKKERNNKCLCSHSLVSYRAVEFAFIHTPFNYIVYSVAGHVRVLVKFLHVYNICPDTHPAMYLCVQAEMEMESLLMARKQLLQQWNSSLVGMRRRDEAFSAMQEAMR